MKKSKYALGLLLAVFASLLFSCGSDEHTSQMDNSRNDSTAIDSSRSGSNTARDSGINHQQP